MTKKNRIEKADFVDWHKLCLQLQEGLAKEMRENQDLIKEINDLTVEIHRHQGVIMYLHKQVKNGNNPV
jgi:hypothetical protein